MRRGYQRRLSPSKCRISTWGNKRYTLLITGGKGRTVKRSGCCVLRCINQSTGFELITLGMEFHHTLWQAQIRRSWQNNSKCPLRCKQSRSAYFCPNTMQHNVSPNTPTCKMEGAILFCPSFAPRCLSAN